MFSDWDEISYFPVGLMSFLNNVSFEMFPSHMFLPYNAKMKLKNKSSVQST